MADDGEFGRAVGRLGPVDYGAQLDRERFGPWRRCLVEFDVRGSQEDAALAVSRLLAGAEGRVVVRRWEIGEDRWPPGPVEEEPVDPPPGNFYGRYDEAGACAWGEPRVGLLGMMVSWLTGGRRV